MYSFPLSLLVSEIWNVKDWELYIFIDLTLHTDVFKNHNYT